MLFFAFRIAQARLMLLMIIHGLNPNAKLKVILEGCANLRYLWSPHLSDHAFFMQDFFQPNSVYIRFTHVQNLQPKFYISSSGNGVMSREHSRLRKYLQLGNDRLVQAELSLRYWHEQNSLFTWAPLPIFLRRPDFHSLELALVQEWQPRLNYPFICQFFHPRKGLLKRPAMSLNPQFGLATLWRKRRHRFTPLAVKEILGSPWFQNRLAMWKLIHDQGSNTKSRFEATKFPRSHEGGLTMSYALRRLASNIQEPFRTLSLQAIDTTIAWWKGKPAPKAAAIRLPWSLSPDLERTVFVRSEDSPIQVVEALVDRLQNQYSRSYPWAIGRGRQTPSGYILSKAKKEYRSGRPIISFVDAPFRPMLNILARLLYQLIPVGCPHHFAVGDVYELLTIFKSIPENQPLRLFNQDLAGFFTSIEPERFIGAWFMLLDFLRPKMNVNDEVFSVYPGKSNKPGDVIKGRTFRRLNVTRKIVIGDVPSLLTTALDMQTFALGGRCIKQRRGSPMGSPLSPAMCLMVVSIGEEIWFHNFKEILSNHHLFVRHIRYVDNRLLLGDPGLVDLPPYETLLDDGFYGRPILLETEPDQEFLGFMIATELFELIYCGPRDTSQVWSRFSASPPKVLLSGFRSRCHIVAKGAHPLHRVHAGIQQLIDLYTLAGFEATDLQRISSQILTSTQLRKLGPADMLTVLTVFTFCRHPSPIMLPYPHVLFSLYRILLLLIVSWLKLAASVS
eukprot:s3879_g3.t1